MGLPRELRLRRRADFARVAAIGQGRANNLVVLRYTPNDLPAPRSGFSVSRRIGSAVRRNKVRRRMREVMRKLAPSLGAHDLVLIARPEVADADYDRVEAAVADVLTRAGLLTAKAGRETGNEPARSAS